MALLDTDEKLFIFLYDWVNKILNTEQGLNIPIIQSHQNAPAPDFPYIVIDYTPIRNKIGRAYKTEQADDGEINIIQDYEYLLKIYEVGSSGNKLQILIDSLERNIIKDLFFINQISFLNNEQIQVLPRLDLNDWIKEAVVEIRLGISTHIRSNDDTWIETVEYEGTYNN